MFFIISKILAFITYPFTWIVIFIILAFRNKDFIQKRKLLITSILLILFFSNTFIFDAFMRAWEIQPIKTSQLPDKKIAIMLTGMTAYSPEVGRIDFNDRTDRLMQTIDLYHHNKISKIILCGGSGSLLTNDKKELTELHSYLVRTGIPDSILIDEFESKNTYENSVNSKNILDKLIEKDTVILITSAYHMRRATGCFRKQGINVIPFATDCYSGPIKYEIDYLLLPSSQTMMNWEKLIHEWVGCIVYDVTGKI